MQKLLILFMICWIQFPAFAAKSFSIYLVRHAEKQAEQSDPTLTSCGQLRAKQLAKMLSTTTIEAVYSTAFQRTMATAIPLASAKNLAIKNYAPNGLPQLALRLKQLQQNALVVGHSNTTPLLAELLSEQTVAALSEDDYEKLYQIQFIGDDTIVTVLTQPLACSP